MASGATVKLGVEGISQFKNNMNQAKQAVKTLDAQLSLSEKQFKATGDSESYMTEKTELLKAKLEQQKAVVDNAQKALDDMASRGVDRASKAYQDMYRQMITAKGAMIDTENQLNGVADSGDKAADGVSEMNAQLERIGKSVDFDKVARGFGSLTDGLEKAARKAIGYAKQIAGAMIEAGSWADDLNTRAANYGISQERLQRMEKTSKIIDTSVESIISSQKKLRMGLGKEDKEVMGGLVELLGEGYDPRGKDWEDVFWDAGEALMHFTDAEEKEVYAQKLFGRSWSDLIPLFTAGRKEYEEMNASWKVVSQESVDSLQSMQDEYDKLMANWETFKYEALAQFAQPMEQAFVAAQGALGKFMDYLKSEEGQQLIDNVVNSLKAAIEWISEPENIQKAIDGLKALIIGWGALKLVGGGLQVLNLVNGAKGLLGGGAGAGSSAGAAAAAGGSGSASTVGTVIGTILKKAIPAGIGAGLVIADSLNNHGDENQWSEEEIERIRQLNAKGSSGPTIDMTWGGIGERFKTAGEWTFDDNLSAAEAMALVSGGVSQTSLGNPAGLRALEEATADLTGASTAQRQSSTEMSEAAGTMKGLPGVIEGAILAGMGKIKVYIDGQQAGGILTPYVNNVMAGVLTGIVKP